MVELIIYKIEVAEHTDCLQRGHGYAVFKGADGCTTSARSVDSDNANAGLAADAIEEKDEIARAARGEAVQDDVWAEEVTSLSKGDGTACPLT